MQSLYFIAYKLHKSFKQRKTKKLPCKVLSIGNITTGGTGKTPTAIAIAEESKKRNLYPIILTRGYKGKGNQPCLVSASDRPIEVNTCRSVKESGDEPYLMAHRLKDVPIIRCPDRYRGGIFALENMEALFKMETINYDKIFFILDDGFQHWSLQRDLDVVLIDGTNPFGNGRLLPFGNLREPINELKRANIIVITKGDNKLVKEEIRKYNQSSPIYQGHLIPMQFVDLRGCLLNLKEIHSKRVFAFSGLGNNKGFVETVWQLSPSEVFFKPFRDHHRYSQSDMAIILSESSKFESDFIITTEKDIVKIQSLQTNFNIYALKVNMHIEEKFFNNIFEALHL